MRWWACSFGHSNPITSPSFGNLTWQACPSCRSGWVYRIELNVPEDNPDKLVERPFTGTLDLR